MRNTYNKLLGGLLLLFLSISLVSFGQDAGVKLLLSPVNKSCGSTAGVIKVIVYNYGGSSISNIPVQLNVTGTSSLSLLDTLKKTLGKGGQDTLTFKKTINTYSGGTYTFKAWSILSGDISHANDTLVSTITISGIPSTPTGVGGTRCGAGNVTFKAPSTTTGSKTYWYNSNTSTIPIASGDSTVQNIGATTTLYASSSSGGGFDSLTSSFAGGNNYISSMFDIKPTNDVTLDSFDISSVQASVDTVYFYYKTGTYIGYSSTKSAWTFGGKAPIYGSGSPVRINFGKSITVKGNALTGICFYLLGNAKKSTLYQTTSTVSDTSHNSTMKISSGLIFKAAFTSASASYYKWNGRIYYSGNGCASPLVAVTGTIKSVVKGLALSKDKKSAGAVNDGSPSKPDQICMGDTLKYDMGIPSNFLDADYGTKWSMAYSLKTAKGSVNTNFSVVNPSSKTSGTINFYPKGLNADSTYILTITATNIATGCDTNIVRYIFVNESISAKFTTASACFGQFAPITNSSTPAGKLSFGWDFGNGDSSYVASPNYKYKTAGTYTINMLAYNGGCQSLASQSITIYNAPYGSLFSKGTPFKGQFNGGDNIDPDNICLGDTNTYQITPPKGLSNSDYGTKWIITGTKLLTPFGNSIKDTLVKTPTTSKNASYSFFPTKYADSVFILTINLRTLPGKCDSVLIRYIHVRVKPIGGFTFVNACAGLPLTFKDSSKVIIGSITNWAWDFGDGATSNQQNPNHGYAKAGTYKVSMTATTDVGCTASTTKSVQEYPRPVVGFNQNAACNTRVDSFFDASTIATGAMKSWKWSFGDAGAGNTSTTQNATHVYPKSGPYNVKLVVTSSLGCKDSITKKMTILPSPVPIFTFKPVCVGLPVYFGNTSVDTFTGTTYLWNFGDGKNSTLITPNHTYTANGVFKITLKVISKTGCSDTLSQFIAPYPKPFPNFGYGNACLGQDMFFYDSSKSGSGTTYTWKYGDGKIDTNNVNGTAHIYNTAGAYAVKLIMVNSIGCADSELQTITVSDVPKAGFTGANVCLGQPISFTNTSTGAGTLSYSWNLGDKSPLLSTKDVVHKFAKASPFVVKMKVTNAAGCSDSLVKSIIIYALPAVPTWTSARNGYTVTFSPKDSTESTYKWHFGTASNDSSSKKSPVFTYPSQDAKYQVSLTVTNINGCSNSNIDSLDIEQSGIAGASGAGQGIFVFPNPFDGSTHLTYTLPGESQVKISVYDIQGRELATLKDGRFNGGLYTEVFDARKYNIGAGVYYLRMEVNEASFVTKIVFTH